MLLEVAGGALHEERSHHRRDSRADVIFEGAEAAGRRRAPRRLARGRGAQRARASAPGRRRSSSRCPTGACASCAARSWRPCPAASPTSARWCRSARALPRASRALLDAHGVPAAGSAVALCRRRLRERAGAARGAARGPARPQPGRGRAAARAGRALPAADPGRCRRRALGLLEREGGRADRREERVSGPLVTRFAPSPTGHLHVGGARTALFNWALAQPSRRPLPAAHRRHGRRALHRGRGGGHPRRPRLARHPLARGARARRHRRRPARRRPVLPEPAPRPLPRGGGRARRRGPRLPRLRDARGAGGAPPERPRRDGRLPLPAARVGFDRAAALARMRARAARDPLPLAERGAHGPRRDPGRGRLPRRLRSTTS